MPNTGDFDPANAIQGARQQRVAEEARKQREEAERQRARAQANSSRSYRANRLKLLRYADEELENIRNPVVSEFVVTETWWTPEPKWISPRQKRADQHVIETQKVVGFFSDRIEYKVATRHERQTRYYGSWLSLNSEIYLSLNDNDTYRERTGGTRSGMARLGQPRAGYVFVRIDDWDPRNVGNITIDLTDRHGREMPNPDQHFRIFALLKEVNRVLHLGSVEELTKEVTQALDFVATGQPPKPTKGWVEFPDRGADW